MQFTWVPSRPHLYALLLCVGVRGQRLCPSHGFCRICLVEKRSHGRLRHAPPETAPSPAFRDNEPTKTDLGGALSLLTLLLTAPQIVLLNPSALV